MKYGIGQFLLNDQPITINEGKKVVQILVTNTGDRSIQVCSHYHFFEANLALKFDREKAFGMRLDIPSGMASRFEPGEDKRVNLVPFGGNRNITGFMGLTMGNIDDPRVREEALAKMAKLEDGKTGRGK